MIFGLKLYNRLPIDVKNITNIKYFRKIVKKMFLQMCPYLEDSRLGVTSFILILLYFELFIGPSLYIFMPFDNKAIYLSVANSPIHRIYRWYTKFRRTQNIDEMCFFSKESIKILNVSPTNQLRKS